MATPARIRLFKIITILVFSFVIVVLITKIADFISPANSNAAFELNKSINDRNTAYAKGNTFGFTDKERATKKPKGIYRIAVIGDSFIWGDGMPYEKVWSHKLERKLLSEYDSVEVISWGKNGWSTLDEFNFFKQHGKDFDVDLLIIGWVSNDPDVGKIPKIYAADPAKKFPMVNKISPMLARFLLNNSINDANSEWMKEIYRPQNLNDYQQTLKEFDNYLAQNNVRTLVVMTPWGFDSGNLKCFNTCYQLIKNANFTCLNLYDSLNIKLGHYSSDELMANPANVHPGDLLTEEYSNEVINYLQQNNYLSKLHKKGL